MGWRDCQIDVGTFSDHEMDARHPEVVGIFGGYLFINASTARMFGVRGPGLAPEMIDATYFGTHPDVPPYIPEPWHENEDNTAKLAAWMGRVMTAQSLPELLEDQKISHEARASRPDLANLDEVSLVHRLRSFTATLRRDFQHHLDMTAGTSIGPGALGAIAAALGDPSLVLTEQLLSLTEQLLSLVRTDQPLEAPTPNHPATPKAPPQPTIGQQTDAPNASQSHQQPTRTNQRSKQTSSRQ